MILAILIWVNDAWREWLYFYILIIAHADEVYIVM